MPRPRGGDWLADELASLKSQGFDHVLSLLTGPEQYELDLLDEPRLAAKAGLTYTNFPIEDRAIATREAAVSDLLGRLSEQLRVGTSIVVHCRQGLGRSASIAAAVMVILGTPSDEVFQVISRARGFAVPDTEEQRAWALSIGARLAGPR